MVQPLGGSQMWLVQNSPWHHTVDAINAGIVPNGAPHALKAQLGAAGTREFGRLAPQAP
eukprot:gene18116-biopygen8383